MVDGSYPTKKRRRDPSTTRNRPRDERFFLLLQHSLILEYPGNIFPFRDLQNSQVLYIHTMWSTSSMHSGSVGSVHCSLWMVEYQTLCLPTPYNSGMDNTGWSLLLPIMRGSNTPSRMESFLQTSKYSVHQHFNARIACEYRTVTVRVYCVYYPTVVPLPLSFSLGYHPLLQLRYSRPSLPGPGDFTNTQPTAVWVQLSPVELRPVPAAPPMGSRTRIEGDERETPAVG